MAAAQTTADKQSKTRQKGIEAAGHVVSLFSPQATGHPYLNKHSHEAPSVRLQDTIDLPIDPSEGIVSYERIEFSFKARDCNGTTNEPVPQPDELRSQQHIHFSSPNLKANLTLFDPHGQPLYERIDIFTGMCLFSPSVISESIPEDDYINAEILELASATSYELDFVNQASSALADFTAALLLTCRSKEIYIPIHISMDMPSIHYYAYIDQHVRAWCSTAAALRCLRAVKHRHAQIAKIFEETLRHRLEERGVAANASLVFSVTPTQCLLADLIHDTLAADYIPSFDSIWPQLRDGQATNSAWTSFLALLPQKELPKSFSDLAHLLHVYEVVRLPLEQQSKSTARSTSYPTSSPDQDLNASSVPGSPKPKDRRPQLGPRSKTTDSAGTAQRRGHLVLAIDVESQRRIYKRAQPLYKSLRAKMADAKPGKKGSASKPTSGAELMLLEAYMMPNKISIKGEKDDVRRVDSGCDVSGDDPQEARLLPAPAGQGVIVDEALVKAFATVGL